MRVLSVAAVFAALGIGCVGVWAEPSAAGAEGFDALKMLVGNTLTTIGVPGGERVIYLGKDGTLVGLIDGRREVGKWTFTDGKLCFVKGTGGRSECGVVKVTGSAGTFAIDGHDIGLRIQAGNRVDASKAEAPTGADSKKLTGSKAAEALVGNTVEGKIADKGLTTVFMDKDGTLVIRQDKNLLKGKWSIDGDTMCTDVGGHKDCFEVAVEGTRVTWTPPKKTSDQPIEFTLLTGNAHNL